MVFAILCFNTVLEEEHSISKVLLSQYQSFDFFTYFINPITRQAIELESCSNPLRIQQVL